MNDIKKQILESDKPVVQLIQKGDNFKVIAIGLNAGVILKKHKAPDRAKIFVAKGSIEYISKKQTQSLVLFDEFEIPLDEEHEVKANEPSLFLLIIGK